MNQKKIYNKDDIVTVGILEEILDEKLDERFVKQDESYARMFALSMEKLDMVLHSMNEYRQETKSATASCLRNEREIDELGERVLKLETAK